MSKQLNKSISSDGVFCMKNMSLTPVNGEKPEFQPFINGFWVKNLVNAPLYDPEMDIEWTQEDEWIFIHVRDSIWLDFQIEQFDTLVCIYLNSLSWAMEIITEEVEGHKCIWLYAQRNSDGNLCFNVCCEHTISVSTLDNNDVRGSFKIEEPILTLGVKVEGEWIPTNYSTYTYKMSLV